MAAVVTENSERHCEECGEVATIECSVCHDCFCKICAEKHFRVQKPKMIEINREDNDANTNKKL